MSFRTVFYSALAVTFAAHYFLYRSLVRFFGIESRRHRRRLAVTLAVLAVSYLPAHWLTHHFENAFTRGFSLAAGLWLGFFLHLLIASALGRLVLFVSGRAGRPLRPALAGVAAISLAAVFTGHGVWSAFNPAIRDADVAVKGLPEGITLVQISDVHLGQVHGAGFMEKVVSLANEAGPDAVVITGDLFDGGDGALYDLALPLRGLNAPMGVYFVSGNHDNHAGDGLVRSILERLGVRVLDDEAVEIGGLQLVGVGYRRGGFAPASVLGDIPGYDPGLPNVLLYHSPVGADALAQAADAGIDLQLSGHTHHGQVFPFGYVTRAVFDGYDFGLYDVDGMALNVSCGAGTWGPPMRTGAPPEVVRITLVPR